MSRFWTQTLENGSTLDPDFAISRQNKVCCKVTLANNTTLTPLGLRIMAFGVLFDMNDNNKIIKITKASDMVKEKWFLEAVNYPEPVDIYVIIGHNSARQGRNSPSTFVYVQQAIRALKPDVPIQIHGGHSHLRDFVVYDESTTALEPGMSIKVTFASIA
jgi:hypothetical protein